MVKVKVEPATAIAVLAAVRHALPGAAVAADANGSFADPAAVAAVGDGLAGLGLAFLEQPLPAGTTWDELAALNRALPVPVALDESLTSADAVRAAVSAGAADVVSVKPARLGGVERAAAAVHWCREQGVDAFVGGMFELGVGRAAAAAVAALDGCTLPTDLGPSDRYVDEDVTGPVVIDGAGQLVVPAGVGSGRTPDPDRLAAVTVDEVLVSG
jgi:O-succinylbenzoate synthase